METITRDIRSIPLWLLRDYLVELGGKAESDTRVVGQGWTAQLTELEDFQLGDLKVAQVRLELEGEDLALKQVTDGLEPRLLRAGAP